jgi:hypothetical protein
MPISASIAVSGGDWFVTRSELKTHLGISDSSEDTRLDEIIADVSAMIRSYTGRWLTQKTYTDQLYSGRGFASLFLREYPVTAVSDVRVSSSCYGGAGNDDAFPDDSEWTQNSDFILSSVDASEDNSGELVAIRQCWPQGHSNIRVGSYTAGYASVPGDLKLACFQLCARVRAAAEKGVPLQSEHLGDYSYQIMTSSTELVHARKILNSYRRV